jgi:hypothetical protein
MANLLTGDYDAVLQVSASTVNRLLASMHQNAWRNPNTPSFPHSVGIRLGDVVEVDGVRGTAWAQVGVPRITLIDESTNRFHLEVGVRIRYVADPDTEPLATYIHGTVGADYELADIDPNCRGWKRLTSKYLWFRVVEDSVWFSGTTGEDDWLLSLAAAGAAVDEAALMAKITTQLATLLAFTFDPAPQEVGPRFRRGSFKTLNQGPDMQDDVPVGGSAVVLPVGLSQGPPVGSVNSLTNVLLDNRDFAAAVSREAIMAMVQPALDEIQASTSTTPVTASTAWGYIEITTVYHSWINQNSVTASWVPYGSSAVITISASGHAHTESVLPDFDFDVSLPIHVEFDPGGENLWLWAGDAWAKAATGTIADDLVPGELHKIENTIAAAAKQKASDAIGRPEVQTSLQSVTAGRGQLVTQLKDLDDQSDAHFKDASFYMSGIVLRGRISVARRRRPEISFQKIDPDGLSALESWIPGGRIDRLRWSWTWFLNAHPPGDHTDSDRYVLRREPALVTGGGMMYPIGREPLPGLDGMGVVCLSLTGVSVDTTTGQLVPVDFGRKCIRFGHTDLFRPEIGRLFLNELVETPAPQPPHPPSEAGLLEVTARGGSAGGPNKLVVYVNERWDERAESTLLQGVSRCRRDDAGLLVLVVFRQGLLSGAGEQLARHLFEFAERLPAAMVATEDIDGAWADAFSVPAAGHPVWRLVSPGGGTLWRKDEELEADELSRVLDSCLYSTAPAQVAAVQDGLRDSLFSPAGIGAIFWHPHHRERPHCPPGSSIRSPDFAKVASKVSFVRKDSSAAAELLARLREQQGDQTDDDEPGVVVVLDGATDDEAEQLTESLGPAVTVVPDPDGALASAVGVRFWPTTVAMDDLNEGRD